MAPKNRKVAAKQPVIQHKSNKSVWIAIAVMAILIISVGAYFVLAKPPEPVTIAPTKVLLQTTAGNITLDLRTDKPITSGNFINIVKEGLYDGTTFHRTVKDFMIQGGKVNSNVAQIQDEIGSDNHNTAYTIAMAKTNQPNSATSEFFINTVDNSKISSTFDSTYAVFGTVISGQDVVKAISEAPATANPIIPNEISTPVNPVTIIKASIIS